MEGKLRSLEACTFSLLTILAGTGASHPRSQSKLIFSFQDHPYFLNTVIIRSTTFISLIKRGSWGGDGGCERVWMIYLQDPHPSPLSFGRVKGTSCSQAGHQEPKLSQLVVRPQLPRIKQDC